VHEHAHQSKYLINLTPDYNLYNIQLIRTLYNIYLSTVALLEFYFCGIWGNCTKQIAGWGIEHKFFTATFMNCKYLHQFLIKPPPPLTIHPAPLTVHPRINLNNSQTNTRKLLLKEHKEFRLV